MPLDVRIYFDDFDDLNLGYQNYLADLKALSAKGSPLANIGLRLATNLQSNVKRLNRAFNEKHTPKVLNTEWQASVLVFVGDAGTKLFTRKIGNLNAIAIDLDLVLRLVLLTHLIGLDNEDEIVTPALAGFLLLSIVVPREEEFPRLYDLIVSTSEGSERIINDLFTIIGNFILFHELGHIYARQYGTDFLRAVFEIPSGIELSSDTIRSIRLHQHGPIYNQIELLGTQNGLLVISPLLEHWKEEFSSDIFAAYADVLAVSPAIALIYCSRLPSAKSNICQQVSALRLLSDIGSPLSPCLRLVLLKVVRMTPFRKMYRGLSPHKIMPMPGTHNTVNTDAFFVRCAHYKCAGYGRR